MNTIKKIISIFIRNLIIAIIIYIPLSNIIPNCFTINISPSMDTGIYYLSNIKKLKKGDIVIFRTPPNAMILYNRNYLEKRVKYLIKNVAGKNGDLVEIEKSKLYLNGVFLGEISKQDKSGRLLISSLKNGIIPKNKVLLIGNTKDSYDSRYFGLINSSKLIKKAKLIYKFKN